MIKVVITHNLKRQVAEALSSQPVLFAYLFGSQVTGNIHEESDIDIAVYLDSTLTKSQRFDKKLELMGVFSEIFNVSDEKVDVVILNDAPLLLRHVSKHEGIVLYEKDRLSRAQYELRLRQEVEEEEHYRQAYNKKILKRLAEQNV